MTGKKKVKKAASRRRDLPQRPRTIERNSILENGDDGINFESNVAKKYGDDDPAVPARNRVRFNQVLRNKHEGIHIYSGSNNLFEENWVRDSSRSGVVMDCQAGSRNVVSSNTIERSGRLGTELELNGNGVVLANPDPVRVESNEIRENPWHGVQVERVTCPVGEDPSYSTGATGAQAKAATNP